MLMTMSLICLFVAVTCVVAAAAPDYTQRVIRERILTEVGMINGQQKRSRFALWLSSLGKFNKALPVTWIGSRLTQDLTAGHVNLNVLEFLTMKELFAIVAFVGYMVAVSMHGLTPNPVFMVGLPFAAFLLPDVILKQRIKARREAIVCELPEVVDLLHLCV